ncbi:MAG: hypothetical protein II806_02340 [Bacteroidaceae bacterium]|nr:hypothetical protein [Bacteroidaceae bacterium]
MKHLATILSIVATSVIAIACSDSDDNAAKNDGLIDIGDGESIELTEEYYAGGVLGTVFNNTANAYEQPTPATEQGGFSQAFQNGEYLFERDFNQNKEGAFKGLGPVYVRNGCIYCHPGYGHGKRQTEYRASTHGNGYLLVIYDKQTEAYIKSVAGMPQTMAVRPFKAPVDESLIRIEWKDYTDEWGNRFPDGETYALIYPEVTIPQEAFYAPIIVTRNGQNVEVGVDEIGVKLESTIGVYGTGLLDAISDDDITAQWEKESDYFNGIGKTDALNPAYWDQANKQWVSYYKGLTGVNYVRRYTYAMSRGPLLDAAGANAIWNITNVTRSDRRYHYLDLNYNAKNHTLSYYAQKSSKDPEVQAEFYNYFPEWNKTGNVEQDIYNYLTNTELPAEMTDDDYKDFMVWHRGLAVPAARNVKTEAFQQGKKLFSEIGCAACHRPSWTTGDDEIHDPNGMLGNNDVPRYPNQKIWPYTDMVQHRLRMVNDIRTGWCRTTPLWGRGLSKICTNAEDRLHDCRARNTVEAIMWHGSSNSDARKSVENFRALSKEERAAVVKFIESI